MDYSLFLHYLKKLFKKPEIAFIEIKRENYASFKEFFMKYLIVFFILVPFAYLLKNIIAFHSIKHLFLKGIFMPLIFISSVFIVLYILSIIVEESGKYFGARIDDFTGVKICFFSALPSLSIFPLSLIPYVGNIFILTAIVYWVYLMYVGSKTIMFFTRGNFLFWSFGVILSVIILLLLGLNILGIFSFLFSS